MEVAIAIAALGGLLWWAAYARWGSLWMGCGAFIALGYVLAPPLWTAHIGPIPLTVDRVLLIGFGAAYIWKWRQGELALRHISPADWLLLAAIGYFTVRCAMTPTPPPDGSTVKPWWRLIAAFWIPAALYLAARTSNDGERRWRGMLWILAGLGGFLAFTAFAEITKQWWAVFPRYISDPLLGTHFGRARGPSLNSASLGIMLTVCFWAAWMLWPKLSRLAQGAVAGLLLAIAGGIFLTFTRSTWIGLAAGLAVVPALQLPKWRTALAIGVILGGAIGVVALGDKVTNLSRKDSDASAEHSVYQRASFVYVSMRMWRDAPLLGCGFGRYYDLKMPYLSDRSQQLELESLRNLDHHNTVLSILVETGIVGVTLFLALLVAWTRMAWQLYRAEDLPMWERSQGLFQLAVVINYLSSALFHDLTLLPTEHWPLFLSAGVSSALLARRAEHVTATQPVPTAPWHALPA
ncbi:O-antigen ligase family protein [Lacipirellula sp.]|uniref:O-antigen ligase family protein n=1 Tax=Lacipirellula sp. TaxID=2691419 RepID=UPI003D0FB5F0